MYLRLGRIKIKDVQWGTETKINDNILFINRDELDKVVKEDKLIKSVTIELARPGESVRIIPVKDVIEPRVKVDGPGGIFPGFVGPVETVGEGTTHVLDGAALVTCGRLVNFQEGIIDMSGPGAKYSHRFAQINNIVLVIEPVDNLGKHEHERVVRTAGLRAAAYLGEAGREVEPDEVEIYDCLSIPEYALKYPELPKVVYVHMMLSQGLMHDTYVYGVDAKNMLPTLIAPTEFMDGAVVSGNCAGPCHKNTTYHHQNDPIVHELFQRHGKDLCFLGVILTNEKITLTDKERASSFATKMARVLGADGVIISEDGGGNPETDLMMNCRKMEAAGIKTVLFTDEYAGRDGGSQGLADITPEADAVITNGNGNELVTLPAMDKVIGHLEAVELITGGFAGSLNPDGSITVEIASILGSCCELGFGNISCRTR
jgi:sarcosine reductase